MAATNTPTSAPSAAPAAAAPASPAAPVTPAPVAAATAPTTLNDFAELARLSITGENATPAPDPQAPGQEPSPEPAAPEPAELSPAAEPSPEPVPEDPAAEDTANWTEGEKKLHGALVKERAESKEARAKLREALDRLALVESKLNHPTAPQAEPVTPAAQPSAVPVTGEQLADCQTFEAVDARVQQAATTEAQAVRLQNMLNRNGTEPVAERLKASGVETIDGVPVAEASADQIGDFLASVYEGARMAQAQAPMRKDWLVKNQQALQRAVQAVPEFNDPNSDAFKAASRIVQENPVLRQRADWPVVLAKLYLGEQGFDAKLTKPAAVVPPKPAPKPAAKPAPGAPRTTIAALPQANGVDALKAKIAKGTATLAEVQEYTRGHVVAA